MNELNKNIIFFDGICGLCNGFVDFILRIDKKKKFLFSPLQSEYALSTLPKNYTEDLTSIVVLINGETYSKSAAVLKVMQEIGGSWKLLGIAKIFPQSLSDSCYNLVAKNRYKLFGKKDTCRLPSQEERERFII